MSDSVSPLGITVDALGQVKRIGYAAQAGAGPLPLHFPGFYTTQARNALALFASGSAFRGAAMPDPAMQVDFSLPEIAVTASAVLYANETGSHKALVPTFRIAPLTSVPVGTQLSLDIFVAGNSCVTNSGDYFRFLLVEFL